MLIKHESMLFAGEVGSNLGNYLGGGKLPESAR